MDIPACGQSARALIGRCFFMDAIVAVYSHWGIGAEGTQPLVLHADRAFFRRKTEGAAIVVGRTTLADFPGGKPLKGRFNIVMTRKPIDIEGAYVASGIQQALDAARAHENAYVVGGASVYMQFFPYLERVYVTQIDAAPQCTAFFPNLDRNPDWQLLEAGPWQQEDGVRYRFCTYERLKSEVEG